MTILHILEIILGGLLGRLLADWQVYWLIIYRLTVVANVIYRLTAYWLTAIDLPAKSLLANGSTGCPSLPANRLLIYRLSLHVVKSTGLSTGQ